MSKILLKRLTSTKSLSSIRLFIRKKKKFKITKSSGTRKIYVILVLIISILLGLSIYITPSVKDRNAKLSDFSSIRATDYLKNIAKEPHPVGSKEHDKVRDYLFEQLTDLGLKPEIQKGDFKVETKFGAETSSAENIIARIEGTQKGKAVLLVAHYDSAKEGPGAADNASSVACILETVRALKFSEPLKNDIIVLFSDAEEIYLNGAGGFVQYHPWFKDVGIVINFEAKGSSGPSIMFETSANNSAIVNEYIKAADFPVTFSLTNEMYKMMPNDTDLSVFKNAGIQGINFAFANSPSVYHTKKDTISNLSMNSLQHQGENVLNMARHFGNIDLNRLNTSSTDCVYFSIIHSVVVSYPNSIVLPLSVIVIILYFIIIIYAIKSGEMKLKNILKSFFKLILCTFISIILALIITIIICIIALVFSLRLDKVAIMNFYLLTLIVIASLSFVIFYIRYNKNCTNIESIMGSLLIWIFLDIITSILMKGVSYLFFWPFLLSIPGIFIVLLIKKKSIKIKVEYIVFLLLSAPSIILLIPIIYLLNVAMFLAAFPIQMLLIAMILSVLIPSVDMFLQSRVKVCGALKEESEYLEENDTI